MGYTHCWRRPVKLPPEPFGRVVADCRRLLPETGVPLAGSDGTGRPQFCPTTIAFNGITGQFYETFLIELKSTSHRPGPLVMEFCKTAHRPYDLAVQVTLIIFKHHMGACFQVSSDGGTADWDKARLLCQERLGYGGDFQLERA